MSDERSKCNERTVGERPENERPDAAPAAREVLPLVVCGPDGHPIEVLAENAKGYRKSIERGELWALHGETGRLLPTHEGIGVTVFDRGSWYEARLAASPTPADAPTAGSDAPRRAETSSSATGSPAGTDLGVVLTNLARLIADRHRTMPEGSYTTHLFASGGEKIRKKAGEEAIELLLASSRETLASESADFLYHLLVLLEHEGITLSELAAELESR